MDNKDTILSLLAALDHVISSECRPVPPELADKVEPDSVTFYVHQFIPGAGVDGTDRDNHAEIYVPASIYNNPEQNNVVVDQMREVLSEIEQRGRPEPTFDSDPIIPPVTETE